MYFGEVEMVDQIQQVIDPALKTGGDKVRESDSLGRKPSFPTDPTEGILKTGMDCQTSEALRTLQ